MQRHGCGKRAAFRFRATGLVLLLGHLLIVGWLTLRPLTVPWVTPGNFSPLATVRAELASGPWEAVHSLGGSLLLLAPLGILLPMAKGRLNGSRLTSLTRTVGTGALVSVAIALLQTGVPGRTFDVDTLLLNVAGVGLTHLALVPPAGARLRRRTRGVHPATGRREDRPQGATPRIPRVGITR